MKGLSDVH